MVIEIEPKQEQAPTPLNNFHFYLPGGYYREHFKNNPEKVRLMQDIDKLLTEEFPDLDTQKIVDRHLEIKRVIKELLAGAKESKENKTKLLDEMQKIEEGNEEESLLRPLFERLLEMGYSVDNLTA